MWPVGLVGLALAGSLAVAAPASAFALRHYTLREHHHTILSGITLCSSHPISFHLRARFWPASPSRINVTNNSPRLHRSAGCNRVIFETSETFRYQDGSTGHFADWGDGLWRSRLSVIATDGETHTTGTRSVYATR